MSKPDEIKSEPNPHKNFNSGESLKEGADGSSNKYKSKENKDLDKSSDSETILDYDNEFGEFITNEEAFISEEENIQDQEEHHLNDFDENEREHQAEAPENEGEVQGGEQEEDIQKLLKMDINSDNKDEIIDILMKDNVVKKKEGKSLKVIKEKNNKKYNYIQPTVDRFGFPVKKPDAKISDGDEELALNLIEDEVVQKKKVMTTEEIGKKVDQILKKKKENIESKKEQLIQKEKDQCTFSPELVARKTYKQQKKREFKDFLQDQNNYLLKIKEKNEERTKEKTKKDLPDDFGKPKTNKHSNEIVKKNATSDEPAYLRLFQKSKQNKNNKEEEEKINERFKEDAKKIKEENAYKSQYAHVVSKIDNGRRKKDEEAMPQNDKKENKKLEKIEKEQKEILEKKNKKILQYKDLNTNKMLYNNFEKKYDKELCNVLGDNNKLDETLLANLLYSLDLITYPAEELISAEKEKKTENEKKEMESNPELLCSEIQEEKFVMESALKQNEKKTFNGLFALLKNEQNQVEPSVLKQFLIALIGLQPYYMYKTFKEKYSEKDIDEMFAGKTIDQYEKPEVFIKKYIEEEENASANLPINKYFSVKDPNNIYINLEKSKLIRKDFGLLILNFRNNKKKKKEIIVQEDIKYSFKPKINENSEKMFQKLKDKIHSVHNETVTSNSQVNNHPSKMEYIDRLLIQGKKRIAENQKIKEELERKEMEQCTFKPKINEKVDRNQVSIRIEELYKKGKKDLKSRKDRSKAEIEENQQEKELTFQPTIIARIPDNKVIPVDIHNDKSYKQVYERLKNGRMERIIKNNATERFGLDQEMKDYIKKTKEIEHQEQDNYYDNGPDYNCSKTNNIATEENTINNNNNINSIQNSNSKKEERNYIQGSSGKKNKEIDAENSEDEMEKKEGIPLLIIDVNIRKGVKKKIYVYEGDTPEGLATKFAEEHYLEPETKEKLQNLIHNHMLRLLTRIDEENQSSSEKSKTN